MKRNILFLIIIISAFGSCDKNELKQKEKIALSEAYSIIVTDSKVCISGYAYNGEKYSTKYWIDDVITDSANFVSTINAGSIYRESIDEEFRTTYVYKNPVGEIEIYKFDQGSLAEGGKLFYYKNNDLIKMDTSALGTISSVYVSVDITYFAGAFGKIAFSEGGEYLSLHTPFYWDGASSVIELPLPDGSQFDGVSSIYASDNNDIYVGGVTDVPMYWENGEPIILNTLFGVVSQIKISGIDVYVVGSYNKNNSNSTGHTASYWKNRVLHELEDDAQASGIFIDGTDIYVSGSIGRIPVEYKACYWKNGVRIDLPN